MLRSTIAKGLALVAIGALIGGSTVAVATPTDPCEGSYVKPMNSTAKLKAYEDCRFDRIDKALGVTPTSSQTATVTPSASPSASESPSAPPTATATPSASQTPTASPSATGLNLTREPKQPAADYYARFPKAKAAGWNTSTVPISVFFGKPEHAPQLKALGINTYMGAEHDGSRISTITGQGMSVLAQDEWTTAELGDDTRVVGYFVHDECEMGYSGCGDTATQQLAAATQKAKAFRDRNDGRFLQANFGNGVLNTFWSKGLMDEHVGLLDVSSVDKYAYTSPPVRSEMQRSGDWPSGADANQAASYGWFQDQMEKLGDPTKPNWVFVETAKPYLTEANATSITPDQIDGAVWAGIIHGARGVAYFQHNNNGCGNYSLVDSGCPQATKDRVKAINAKVQSLASVINSDTYIHNYGAAGIDTMTKQADGDLYVFAGVGLNGSTGSKTFTLPEGVTGTQVTVVGENRTIDVAGGKFTDTFASEYSNHVYGIKI